MNISISLWIFDFNFIQNQLIFFNTSHTLSLDFSHSAVSISLHYNNKALSIRIWRKKSEREREIERKTNRSNNNNNFLFALFIFYFDDFFLLSFCSWNAKILFCIFWNLLHLMIKKYLFTHTYFNFLFLLLLLLLSTTSFLTFIIHI